MTPHDVLDRGLSTWLEEHGAHRVPQHLDEVLRITAATRQRPWWSSLARWLPMQVVMQPVRYGVPDRLRVAAGVSLLILLLLSLVAVAISGRPRVPPPFGPAANGSMLFNRDEDIWIADADGRDPRPLISGPDFDADAWYSYDGSKFAFNRVLDDHYKRLLIADADGSNIVDLSSQPFRYVPWWDWSPSGDAIAIVHQLDGRSTFSIVPTDGSGAVRTPDLGGLSADWVYWRPVAGRQLVFRGHPDADPGRTAIYVIDADGRTPPRQVTAMVTYSDAFMEPRMAPDGSRLVFWSNEPATFDRTELSPGQWAHVLVIDDGADRRLRFDPHALAEYRPTFSPDGRTLVLMSVHPGVDGRPEGRLLLAPVDGTAPARSIGPVVTDLGHRHEFLFSPDGTRILMTSTDESVDLASYLIDVATGTYTEGSLANGTMIGFYASWQRVLP